MSPTELRILLALGNVVLFFHPTVRLLGETYRFFDAAGVIGIVAFGLALITSVAKNTLALYRAERIR